MDYMDLTVHWSRKAVKLDRSLTFTNMVWDEITYPFPNFNDTAVEVWEWISNFILHFTVHVITYPCLI